jgi:fatty-acyl-CoA synthase
VTNEHKSLPAWSYVGADTSVPILETTVGGVLRQAATRHSELTALIEGRPPDEPRKSWTYEELLADAETVARALATRFEKGERLAVWAPNIPEWVVLEFGAALAGLVLVTVNPAYQPKELHYVLAQSRSAGIFYVPAFRGNPMEKSLESVRDDLPHLREAISFDDWNAFLTSARDATNLPEVAAGDPVQIQYTSGTTGFPKGALLHHRGITNNARLFGERLGVRPGDVYVNPLPMFHTSGCVLAALSAVQLGVTLVSMEQFDPGLMLQLLESERATHVLGVPTMLIAAAEHPDFVTRNFEAVRGVVSGGATVPADLVRRIEDALGAKFSIIYGQTETSPAITLVKPDDTPEDKAETLGPALPQTEIKVIDPSTGDIVPTGTAGELCTRGYLVMLEYFDMPDKTAETIDEDGWLHTGDLVTMDARGYTIITGRLKDMIIRGGENIYPREIEEVLFEHPSVADVAVVGLPDATWGEVVAAFIRDADPETPADDEELHAYLRQHLAPIKTPKHWFHVADFPLTGSGKIQKFALREMWENGVFDH